MHFAKNKETMASFAAARLSIWEAMRETLQEGWDSILRAVGKQHRSKRTLRHRQAVQIQHFIKAKKCDKFKKCEYCGSYKMNSHACLFCFRFIREKLNEKLAL